MLSFKCEVKIVDVCGQVCHVRELDADTLDSLIAELEKAGDNKSLCGKVLVKYMACDPDGTPCFTDPSQVGRLPVRAIKALVDAGMELNGMGTTADDTKSPAAEAASGTVVVPPESGPGNPVQHVAEAG